MGDGVDLGSVSVAGGSGGVTAGNGNGTASAGGDGGVATGILLGCGTGD